MDNKLPVPVTAIEMYLAALLVVMESQAVSLAAIAATLSRPGGAVSVDTVALRESLLAVKGIGPATADEILKKLLDG